MKNEKGAAIIEASIVFPIVFITVIIMMTLGNAYYQKCHVEAIIDAEALECAAYVQDTLLKDCKEKGKVPDNVNTMPSIEPYKYLIKTSDSSINVNISDTQSNIEEKIKNIDTGFFKGMEVQLQNIVVSYQNYFIYQTITVTATCKVQMPFRMLGSSENLCYYFSVINELPVSDSPEFIRNVDMVIDYLEKYGVNFYNKDMVWIVSTGKKYHKKPVCSNMKEPYQVSLDEAAAMGRDACKKCYQ